MVQPLAVLNILSVMTLVFALSMTLPLAVSWVIDDGAVSVFGRSMAATAVAGIVLRVATKGRRRELQVRDGFLLVASVWTLLPAFGALPLLLYLPELSFTDAYFEAMSGLTATGATVLTGLDSMAPSINLWRGLLQWLGGLGIIVLAVAILPMLGVGGRQLFKAETPGPMKEAQLTPRITESAKGLWLIYTLFTAACALAYAWAGMDWLDALMHAFTTMGLGGFSSHDASFAYWNSPLLEAVAAFFMLIAGVNFATHFLALRSRHLSPYRRDPEAAPYVLVVLASVVVVALVLLRAGVFPDAADAWRHAFFNVVSVATTTGFASTDYAQWPVFAPLWMLFLAGFATCSGSTGGGIKMMRAVLMVRQTLRELARLVHPRAVIPVKLGSAVVENNLIFAVIAFMLVYGVTVAMITMLLTATGLDLLTALSAAAACVNNLGPGLGQIGPSTTYAGFDDFQIWICTGAMLLGRLELLTVFVLLTPAFWRR
jgi:trk system potassium uptake protein TrkH